MSTLMAFIKRHPVPVYFALTFAISWSGFLIVVGSSGIPDTPEQFERLLPSAILVMLAGPSVTSILLTGLVDGRAGFREVLSRLLRWRVEVRWYAVALLIAPLLSAAVLLPLSLTSSAFLPGLIASDDKASRLLFGIVTALVVGVFEELGWTGFAVPRLRLRYGILTTGIIVGVLWGAWHLLTNVLWASDTTAGGLSPDLFLLLRGFGLLVGGLVAFRVLMVWVYDRTGSLLVAMLMHMSLTASSFIINPLEISGAALLIYDYVSAAAWWTIVAAIAIANGGQFSRQPLPRRGGEKISRTSLVANVE